MITTKMAISKIKKIKKVSASFRLDEDLKTALEVVSRFNNISTVDLLEAYLRETDLLVQMEQINKNKKNN